VAAMEVPPPPPEDEEEEGGGARGPPAANGEPEGARDASPPQDGRLRPGAKRVTFPCDEDIVSGAVEPKDPWRHAQNVTVEEIVAAYKQACQKLNCRQSAKLLRQLQEFKDLAPRIDCLDLKGEKLDYRACEALEEIFKRVQFKLVDLEQTSLDEDVSARGPGPLPPSPLEPALQPLLPSFGRSQWEFCPPGAKWQPGPPRGLPERVFRRLGGSVGPGRPSERLVPPILHRGPVRSLRGLSKAPAFTVLTVSALRSQCQLRAHGAGSALTALDPRSQHQLRAHGTGSAREAPCSRCRLRSPPGLAYLCEGLKEQRKGLVTLVLWNNQLTHTGMAYLGMTLPHTQSLETLNLGHNPVGNEGVRNLKTGLIGNRSVLRLGLASTKLTCEGAVAVAEFIAESPRLLRLDLRENEIKTGGLMALSLALKVNHSLLRLDLDREPKKEAVKSFLETQKALLAEIQNGCKRNFVLAREREEQEQRLQQSASMPEIAGTEPPPERESGAAGSAAPAPGEPPRSAENGGASSDSDTEEEEDGMEVKDLSQGAGAAGAGADPPPARAAPQPERRISVSSPGRGHKVFVVTRVEAPPERDSRGARGTLAGAAPVGAAPCEEPLRTAPLPNGLKTDFARALPAAAGAGKAGSCAVEHELNCSKNEKELEELLLEASQDAELL
ncbi:PPR37 phosphatase, partial [Nothoprocta ornata]|nr:PPR37 phosphatase [Nothoprocta ornata]